MLAEGEAKKAGKGDSTVYTPQGIPPSPISKHHHDFMNVIGNRVDVFEKFLGEPSCGRRGMQDAGWKGVWAMQYLQCRRND